MSFFVEMLKDAAVDTMSGLFDVVTNWNQIRIWDRLFFLMPIVALVIGIVISVIGNISNLHYLHLEYLQGAIPIGKSFFISSFVFLALDIMALHKIEKCD